MKKKGIVNTIKTSESITKEGISNVKDVNPHLDKDKLDKPIKKRKIEFFRIVNQNNLLSILTAILIIVTIFSIIATLRITEVSLYLDNLRQKELIISQIDKTNKLIVELRENKNILEDLNNRLESYKSRGEFPIDKISIVRLEMADEVIDNLDQELITELAKYEGVFKTVIQYMGELDRDNINPEFKNDTIDRTKQNVGILLEGGNVYDYRLYGLSDFINKLEKHRQKLQEKLDRLRNCPKCGSHSYTEEEVIY